MSNELKVNMGYEIEDIANELTRTVKLRLEEIAKETVSRAIEHFSRHNPQVAGTIGPSPLSKQELSAVYSLMLFAAVHGNLKFEKVEAMLEKEFQVKRVADIPRKQFQDAMAYAFDLHLFKGGKETREASAF